MHGPTEFDGFTNDVHQLVSESFQLGTLGIQDFL